MMFLIVYNIWFVVETKAPNLYKRKYFYFFFKKALDLEWEDIEVYISALSLAIWVTLEKSQYLAHNRRFINIYGIEVNFSYLDQVFLFV